MILLPKCQGFLEPKFKKLRLVAYKIFLIDEVFEPKLNFCHSVLHVGHYFKGVVTDVWYNQHYNLNDIISKSSQISYQKAFPKGFFPKQLECQTSHSVYKSLKNLIFQHCLVKSHYTTFSSKLKICENNFMRLLLVSFTHREIPCSRSYVI